MQFSARPAIALLSVVALAACGPEGTDVPAAAPAQSVSPALVAASNSTLRVYGDATECNRREFGSGFVVGKDLVETNAHVVAGISKVLVDGPTISKALEGEVVYFDANLDTALVRVVGLGLPALEIGAPLVAGDQAVVLGYPSGESQVTLNGTIERIINSETPDIYKTKSVTREIYEVNADINPGNSGGPLVDANGVVHGMVFAKSPDKASTGYVLLPDAINYVIAQGASATKALATSCIKD